jgi:predicted TIM-barrel fold metal-dependent hydrolase
MTYQPTLGEDRVATPAGLHILAHPFEQMAAMVSMYEAGVFTRFPKLGVLFLEAGVGWVPWWLERIDEERKQYRPGTDEGELMRTAFDRQCWVSAEAGDHDLDRIVDWLGSDRLVFSTDYPHTEATYPRTRELFGGGKMPPETLDQIGRTNCLRAYPRMAEALAR